MTRLFLTSLIVGLATSLCARTAERISATPEEQQAVFEELAAKTYHSEKATDDEGNIIFVCFNHHDRYKKENPDAPGLHDQDLQQLRYFPRLQGLTLQRQPLSDAGFQVLEAFPEMKVISFADLATHPKHKDGSIPTPTFAMLKHLDGMRQLEVLDLTHSFRMPDEPDMLNEMQGFTKLKVLVVDVGIADDAEELLPFVAKSPELERLKLHRTNFSEADFEQLFQSLPNLLFVEIKPRGNEPGKRWSYQSLALIPKHPNIEVLRLIHCDALPLPWENGLEYLAGAESLQVLMFPEPEKGEEERGVKDEDLQRLQVARPDLRINPPRDEWPEKPNPVDYDWEIGPR